MKYAVVNLYKNLQKHSANGHATLVDTREQADKYVKEEKKYGDWFHTMMRTSMYVLYVPTKIRASCIDYADTIAGSLLLYKEEW